MIADHAAEALAERWQEPKSFDIHAPLQVRELQRLLLKNAWLKKRGKDPLPVPAQGVSPAADATTQPLIRAVLDAKTNAKRKKTLQRIEDLGLPALPAVRRVLGSLKADDPARADVQALVSRLALIVRTTVFTADSREPGDALRRKVEALRGKSVTEALTMDLLQGITAAPPHGVGGVRLSLERMPDDTGVYVAITLLAPQCDAPPFLPVFHNGCRFWIGDKSIVGIYHNCWGSEQTLANLDWNEFITNLRTILTAPPEQYVFAFACCGEARCPDEAPAR